MVRNEEEENLHTNMLKSMIEKLKEKNIVVIQADLEGYDKPDEISGKIPDIVGEKENKTRIIIEVETCGTIDIEHTKEQFESFSSADGEFWVDVPKSCIDALKAKSEEWETPVDSWWQYG